MCFRHGRKVTTIVQDYQNYTISIGYKWDENKTCYVITSVRLYKREERKEMRARFARPFRREAMKYKARIYIPTYYEIEADSEKEARRKAEYVFKKENS